MATKATIKAASPEVEPVARALRDLKIQIAKLFQELPKDDEQEDALYEAKGRFIEAMGHDALKHAPQQLMCHCDEELKCPRATKCEALEHYNARLTAWFDFVAVFKEAGLKKTLDKNTDENCEDYHKRVVKFYQSKTKKVLSLIKQQDAGTATTTTSARQ